MGHSCGNIDIVYTITVTNQSARRYWVLCLAEFSPKKHLGEFLDSEIKKEVLD